MTNIETLHEKITKRFNSLIERVTVACGELTIKVAPSSIREICLVLRDEGEFNFKLLIDICGVDYLHYGFAEWETESTTATGFERGVKEIQNPQPNRPRFAVIYHLLSLDHNQRLRIRAFLEDTHPMIASVVDIWPAANWYEREAFDLFGIMFTGHPDLRRILTDYGFVGHPFRKDFPLIGNVEVRYDAKLQRVIYQPVSIKPRILEPKVIRRDNRYDVGQ